MATSTNLLNTKVYEVQETWGGWKDLRAANQAARASPKDIHFFQTISPMESPKIMGLKDIHSSEALQWWGSLTFCPWCSREGQNEGTVVNHLQTTHYHLGLVCACCLDYFTTNAEAIHHHAYVCKPTTVGASDNGDDRERKKTMRMMITVVRGRTRMMSLSLKRTNGLDHINICVYGQGRSFLPSPSGNVTND